MTGIYVVGMPRSGTTLVQSLISTSNEVTSFPETHFFNKTRRLFKPSPSLFDIFLANLKGNSALFDMGIYKFFWATDSRACVGKAHQLMNSYAAKSGYRFYLEKTPSHLYASRSLLELGEECKLVFVVRNLHRSVESYLKLTSAWSKPHDESDVPAAVARWYQDTCLAVLRAREHSALVISYDKLIADETRQHEIDRLGEYLGLILKDDTESIRKAASKIIEHKEYWKENNKLLGIAEIDRPPVPSRLAEQVSNLQSELQVLSSLVQ